MTDQTIKRSGDFFYTEVEDGVKLVGYLGYDYPTYAPEKISGKPVTMIGARCKEGLIFPYQLILPPTVREIDPYATPTINHTQKTWLNKITISNVNPYLATYGSFICTKDLKKALLRTSMGRFTRFDIPKQTEVIGKYLFYNSSISELKLSPNIREIHEHAFSSTGLTVVDIPNTVEYIGDQCFFDELSREKTTLILHGNTRLGQTVANRFKIADDCTAYIEENGFVMTADGKRLLKYQGDENKIVIPESVEQIDDYAFEHVYNDVTVTLNKNLRIIGRNVFASAYIEEVFIPEKVERFSHDSFGRGDPVISIDNANTALRSDGTAIYRRLSNGKEEIVKIIDKTVFRYTVPGTVERFDEYLFEGCDNLTHLTLPEGFKEWNEYYAPKKLRSIVIPSSVEKMTFLDHRDENSIRYIVSEDNENFFTDDDILYRVNDEDNYTLLFAMNTKCRRADIIEGTTQIGLRAFHNCHELRDVIIPESVREIGAYAFSNTAIEILRLPEGTEVVLAGAFYDCKKLTEVMLPKSLEMLSDKAFDRCPKIKEFKVAQGNIFFTAKDGVLFDSDMTRLYCYPFGKTDKEYSIPEGVSKLSFTFGSMPKSSSLERVTLPSTIKTLGGNMFTETRLKDIYFTSDVKIFNAWTISPADYLIIRLHANNCPNITDFVNKHNTSRSNDLILVDCSFSEEILKLQEEFSFDKVSDGYRIYAYKGSGGTVVFPSKISGENVTELSANRGADFFDPYGFVCEIVIPEGIKRIGAGVFMNLPDIRSVSFPKSVENIHRLAFSDRTGRYEGLYIKPKTRYHTVKDSYADKYLSSYHVDTFGVRYPVVVHDGDDIKKTIGTPECFDVEILSDNTIKAEFRYGEGRISRALVPTAVLGRPVTVLGTNKCFIDKCFTELYISKNIRDIQYSEYRFAPSLKVLEIDPENEFFSTDGVALLSKDGIVLYRMFCMQKRKYTVPESVKIIKKHAFGGCSDLTELTITSPVDEIEGELFDYKSTKLNAVKGLGLVKIIGKDAFKGTRLGKSVI